LHGILSSEEVRGIFDPTIMIMLVTVTVNIQCCVMICVYFLPMTHCVDERLDKELDFRNA
jgi:hypothetical protein